MKKNLLFLILLPIICFAMDDGLDINFGDGYQHTTPNYLNMSSMKPPRYEWNIKP